MALYTQTREEVKRDIALSQGGMIHYGTADSATASTIVHDELKRFLKDDALNGKEIDLVGGTGADEAIEINDFTTSSGTVAVVPNFATTPDNTTRYHIYDPSIVTKHLLDTLIAEAVRAIGRQRFVATMNYKLVLDDLLSGIGDMETWTVSTVPDDWTGAANGTWSQETGAAKVRFGSSSAKVVSDGTNLAAITASVNPHYRYDAHNVTAKVWCWTATASRVPVVLDTGSETASSSHGGDSKWEELATASVVIDDLSKLDIICRVTAGGAVTAYFDHARLLTDQAIWDYTLPSGLVAISRIFVEDETEGRFGHIEIPPHLYMIDRSTSKLHIDRVKFPGYNDHRLLIQGLASLTAPTSDSSTIEVPEAVKAWVNFEILARRTGVSVEQLEFAKRRRDEEFALAKRLPLSRNLKWIER